MFNDKCIAVTGGTGLFGRYFVKTLLSRYNVGRLIIFSRDEQKQYLMAQEFPHDQYPQIRYFIGDIRDIDRLIEAFHGVDYVVHAAAIKQITAAEYNPFEAIKTNVLGTQNVIRACIENRVQRAIALSSDKAGAPISLYGATKLCSDKLFVAGNAMSGGQQPIFSVVRYGNVFDAPDSVIAIFLRQRDEGVLTVTDKRMTRFSITIGAGVDFLIRSMERMIGGEIFIPKIPSYRITDLAQAVAPNNPIQYIGIRPGERLNEVLIPEDESRHTIEFGDHYRIIPVERWETTALDSFDETVVRCQPGFTYCSSDNSRFLDKDALRLLVKSHCSPDPLRFMPHTADSALPASSNPLRLV